MNSEEQAVKDGAVERRLTEAERRVAILEKRVEILEREAEDDHIRS
jgi:hypothetical protein